jgi:hypothetical protein
VPRPCRRQALRGQRSDPVDAGAATRPPLALVAFTNEEGARFQP